MPVKETTVEIKLKNLKNNLEYLKSKITSKTKFMAVVKAFSYGSDSRVVSQELERLGVNYLAVAYTQEGIDLRKFGIKTPILVLHPQEKDFDEIIENQLEPSVYSFRVLSFFIKALKKKNKTSYPYHIKFNTGLNRLGFLKKDVFKRCFFIGVPNLISKALSIEINSSICFLVYFFSFKSSEAPR